ncbi:MAG: hypothetical protein AAGG75_00455 [Bacteroidota bacterium]
MSNRKLKVTGFTRFVLFIIVTAPLIYLGASYYNGQDGIQNIKELVGLSDSSSSSSTATTKEISVPDKESTKIKQLEREIESLKEENAQLRQQLEAAESKLATQKE